MIDDLQISAGPLRSLTKLRTGMLTALSKKSLKIQDNCKANMSICALVHSVEMLRGQFLNKYGGTIPYMRYT